jgi:GGDEF domain-containing protein
VAGLRLASLADGRIVAKDWLLALLGAVELADTGSVPVAELARHAPELCSGLVAGLGTDDGLDHLEELAAALPALTGAQDGARVVEAVEALRHAAWAAVAAHVPRGEDALATDLALRLGDLSALVARAAIAALDGAPPRRATATRAPRAVAPQRDAAPSEPGAVAPEASVAPAPVAVPEPEAEEPVARDARADASGWEALIDRGLARHRRDGEDVALLLVEVDDVERLRALQSRGAHARLMHSVEQAVGTELRSGDTVAAEAPGRCWVVAPDTDGPSARALAEAVALAVARDVEHRGTPLTVSVGLATCPADGTSASELVARADEGVFAARAAGVRLA